MRFSLDFMISYLVPHKGLGRKDKYVLHHKLVFFGHTCTFLDTKLTNNIHNIRVLWWYDASRIPNKFKLLVELINKISVNVFLYIFNMCKGVYLWQDNSSMFYNFLYTWWIKRKLNVLEFFLVIWHINPNNAADNIPFSFALSNQITTVYTVEI
jgi:hypothetical protein